MTIVRSWTHFLPYFLLTPDTCNRCCSFIKKLSVLFVVGLIHCPLLNSHDARGFSWTNTFLIGALPIYTYIFSLFSLSLLCVCFVIWPTTQLLSYSRVFGGRAVLKINCISFLYQLYDCFLQLQINLQRIERSWEYTSTTVARCYPYGYTLFLNGM